MKSIIEFIQTDRFKKYFYNTGWGFAERIATLILAFFASIIIARYLGPARFGILSYAVSICTLISPLCLIGLDQISTRELINNVTPKEEILGTSFWIMATGSCLAFILVMLYALASASDNLTKILLMTIGAGLLFDAFLIFKYYNQSLVQMKYNAIAAVLSSALAYGYQIFLVIAKAELVWFGLAFLIQKIVLAAILFLFYQMKQKLSHQWLFSKQLAVKLLKDSWPLLLTGLSIMIYMKIDQVMLKWMTNAAVVGQYAVAARVSEIWYFFPTIISNSIFPALINARKKELSFYHKRLAQLYRLMAVLSLAIAIPVAIFASPIVHLLFGNLYSASASILAIHVWSGIFVFIGVVIGKYLTIENYTRISLIRMLFAMAVNVILNILLIPKYGAIGAAIATLISYFNIVFFIFLIPKTRGHAFFLLRALFLFKNN